MHRLILFILLLACSTCASALESIRIGLLTGTLTIGDVINIAVVVASHREKIMDPELTSILDEIDLRAQVEIAKMKMALDSKDR